MIMHQYNFDEIVDYVSNLDENEFTKRGTTKSTILKDTDTMERLWSVYEKNLDYGCDTDWSLADAVDEVIGKPRMLSL